MPRKTTREKHLPFHVVITDSTGATDSQIIWAPSEAKAISTFEFTRQAHKKAPTSIATATQLDITDAQLQALLAFGKRLETSRYARALKIQREARIALGLDRAYANWSRASARAMSARLFNEHRAEIEASQD